MKNKLLLLLLCVLSFCIVSCEDDDSGGTSADKQTFKVAVIMPNPNASNWKRTMQWALDNFRKAQAGMPEIADIEVELKDENDDDIKQYLQRIAEDDSYTAIIGPYSSKNAAEAAKACAIKKKTIILPLATSTEFQRIFAGKDYIWNLTQSDLTQCEILLMQASASEMSSVCLLTSDDDYGKSFSDWFAYQAMELGLNIKSSSDILIYHNEEDLKNGIKHFSDGKHRNSALLFAPSEAADFISFDDAFDRLDNKAKKNFPVVYCTDVAHSKSLEGKIKNNYEGISPSADPASGFINAYRSKFGEMPVAGEAHLFDAISLLGYALASFSSDNLNETIKNIVDGRSSWNLSWLANDMNAAIRQLQAGVYPDLCGVTGDWTFDQKHHASVLNSSYCHWVMMDGTYQILEYLSTDGSGRTTSTLQTWQTKAERFQAFNEKQENFNYGEHKGNWAVVIGTSDNWANYRHQADAMAMYQILKRHGYDDEHIIMVIADNIAYDRHNIYPGVVRVRPGGENIYHDIKVDYNINDITIDDLKEIMMGNSSERLPEVISSDKNDNIIVFWCGHGNVNSLEWGSKRSICGSAICDMLEELKSKNKYRKMFFAMDACYSGSIGEACKGVPGVLFMTAANAYESSKADMKDSDMGIWLSNDFTRAFQEAIDETPDISMRDLYFKLARQTIGSHVTVYNAEHYGNMYSNSMKEYLN